MIRNRLVLTLFQVALGGLFIYSGIIKVLDPLGFAQDVRDYRVVGQTLSFLAAVVLPWLEIFAGLFLASGLMKRAGAGIISALLVFFIALVAATMIRGLDVDCGCFGNLSRKAGLGLILEDAAMLYMALCVLLAPRKGPPVG